jgi:hypothetical protein
MNTPPLLALALLFSAALAGARADTFIFAPADGDRHQEISRREINVEVDGNPASRQNDITDTVTNVVAKKDADTIRVASTVKSTVETENGKPFANPAFPLIVNRTVTDVFDKNGTFLRIDGNENLIPEAERIFPARVHAAIEKQFSPAAIESGERLVWQLVERGILIGHNIKLNERWESEQPTLVRSKDLTLRVISRVVDLQPPGPGQQATILTIASTVPRLLTPVDRPGIATLDDPGIQDFLTWNIAALPLEKVFSRVTVDTRTLRLVHREKYIVDVDSTPAGIQTRTELETITCKPLD